MKKINKIILIIMFAIFLLLNNIVIAQSNMQIELNKNYIKKEEEIKAKINISNTSIAALTLEIYFDTTRLELVKEPDNSNFANNRILYTWVNNEGKGQSELSIGDFIFKAISDGTASIIVTGEFYNSNGEKINIDLSNTEVFIGENTEQEQTELVAEENENVSKDNTNLSILRLNREGINPTFEKEIKEYYFVTDDASINSLEITAVPENKDAKVTITGNKNLKMGSNVINIEVTSAAKTKKADYKIHVTKTNNLEKANSNLETLAIRQGSLVPEFNEDTTNYKVEVANDTNKLDILAIPQKVNAKVTIDVPETLEIGDNKIAINVLAEDGITKKKYEVVAHRRTEEEEIKKQEEEKLQTEKMATILKEKEEEPSKLSNEKQKNNLIYVVIGSVIGAIIIVATVLIILKYRKKTKKNN